MSLNTQNEFSHCKVALQRHKTYTRSLKLNNQFNAYVFVFGSFVCSSIRHHSNGISTCVYARTTYVYTKGTRQFRQSTLWYLFTFGVILKTYIYTHLYAYTEQR